jgi:hypothetical protein
VPPGILLLERQLGQMPEPEEEEEEESLYSSWLLCCRVAVFLDWISCVFVWSLDGLLPSHEVHVSPYLHNVEDLRKKEMSRSAMNYNDIVGRA